MDNAQELPAEFQGWQALERTLSFLSIHLVIATGVAATFFLVLLFTNRKADLPTRSSGYPGFLLSEFSFILTFAAFGTVTAFFLSLGLKRGESGESVNNLVDTFAAPFVSLLTAGIVFASSRASITVERPQRVAVCVTCFLVTTIVSYRTFFYQILTAF